MIPKLTDVSSSRISRRTALGLFGSAGAVLMLGPLLDRGVVLAAEAVWPPPVREEAAAALPVPGPNFSPLL